MSFTSAELSGTISFDIAAGDITKLSTKYCVIGFTLNASLKSATSVL